MKTWDRKNRFKDFLTTSTIEVLQFLIMLYDHSKIDHTSFAQNIALKIKFLEENFEEMNDIEEKKKAETVINRCHEILTM